MPLAGLEPAIPAIERQTTRIPFRIFAHFPSCRRWVTFDICSPASAEKQMKEQGILEKTLFIKWIDRIS